MIQRYYDRYELTPICQGIFNEVQAGLPRTVARRLTASQAVRKHGGRQGYLLFNVWDIRQNGLLHPNHFCYCIGHVSSSHAKNANGYLHFWANTQRIYQNRIEAHRWLVSRLRPTRITDFRFYECLGPRKGIVEVKTVFDLTTNEREWTDLLSRRLQDLLAAVHPLIVDLVDAYALARDSRERVEFLENPAALEQARRDRPPEKRVELAHAVPPDWREPILARNGYHCAMCGCDLTIGSAHIDHIQPFSKGGLTVPENLQPLCTMCNLKKGNRTDL